MKSQSGFTLIELVVVIILLAIMAATALPRFTNLSGEARLSAVNGMLGAINTASTLAKSKWTAAGSAALDTVDMGGAFISVVSGGTTVTGEMPNQRAMGTPMFTPGTSGMWGALEVPTGFMSAVSVQSGLILWPAGVVTSTMCNVFYSAGVATLQASSVTWCL